MQTLIIFCKILKYSSVKTSRECNKNNVNRNTLGFSNCCQGNHKISRSQVRIHQAWSVSEGDVSEWLLDYIFVTVVVICVFYLISFNIWVFCLVYTFDSLIGMFKVWSQMSDTNFDRENPSDLPALVCTHQTYQAWCNKVSIWTLFTGTRVVHW